MLRDQFVCQQGYNLQVLSNPLVEERGSTPSYQV